MITSEQSRLFNYLEARAQRAFFDVDGELQRLPEIVELVLPREFDKVDEFKFPAISMRLQKIAVAAAAAVKCDVYPDTKPDRVQAKIERLFALLSDPDLFPILATNMGLETASDTISNLRKALFHIPGGETGIDWEKFDAMPETDQLALISEVRKRNHGEAYRPRRLTAIDVGDAVANVLKDAGLPVNRSETGLLARTLESIREATDFPTNSAKTPAKLKL